MKFVSTFQFNQVQAVSQDETIVADGARRNNFSFGWLSRKHLCHCTLAPLVGSNLWYALSADCQSDSSWTGGLDAEGSLNPAHIYLQLLKAHVSGTTCSPQTGQWHKCLSMQISKSVKPWLIITHCSWALQCLFLHRPSRHKPGRAQRHLGADGSIHVRNECWRSVVAEGRRSGDTLRQAVTRSMALGKPFSSSLNHGSCGSEEEVQTTETSPLAHAPWDFSTQWL